MLVAIERTDGGVSIMRLTEGATAETEVAKWSELHAGEYVAHREIKESDVPPDRTFRAAWKPDFTVDMPKARDVHRARIRAERAPLLAALDVEYSRADETGDATAKAKIAARKRTLRDAPAHPGIDRAKVVGELPSLAVIVDSLQ